MNTEVTAIDILTRNQKADPRWVECQNRGYALRERDGDVAVCLYYKDAYITDFNQTRVTIEEVLKEAEAHWLEITRPTTIRWCRHCIYWRQVHTWTGTCVLHSWEKDRWSQDADAGHCPDYVDRRGGIPQYQVVSATKEG